MDFTLVSRADHCAIYNICKDIDHLYYHNITHTQLDMTYEYINQTEGDTCNFVSNDKNLTFVELLD